MTRKQHWTEKDPKAYQLSMGLDFVDQLNLPLDDNGWSQAEFASKVGVSKSRMSQIFNNPDNLTLKTMVKCARAANMRLSIVVYEKSDELHYQGPINGDIFRQCWERLGKPQDQFELQEIFTKKRHTATSVGSKLSVVVPFGGPPLSVKADSTENTTSITVEHIAPPQEQQEDALTWGSLHDDPADVTMILRT